MKKGWQIWLWRCLLLAAFVVALALSLFWANGLQFDFIGKQIRRTGSINISYADAQASVYLDGQKMDGTLPFYINDVLPGRYHLVVARGGYYDYNADIAVKADLITRLDSVFLYPMDISALSQTVSDWPAKEGVRYFLADGYIWRQDQSDLSLARLGKNLTEKDWLVVKGAGRQLEDVHFLGQQVLLAYSDGRRAFLDPVSGKSEAVNLDSSYVPLDGQWLYFKNDVLALFDKGFNKVIWVKQPRPGVAIAGLKYFSAGQHKLLDIDYQGGSARDTVYELQGDKLLPMAQGSVNMVQADAEDNLLYIKNGRELWLYDFVAGREKLLGRFQSPLQLRSANLDVFQNVQLLAVKLGAVFLLADRDWKNVRDMFPGKEVIDLAVVDRKIIYYLEKEQAKTAGGGDFYRLEYFPLES